MITAGEEKIRTVMADDHPVVRAGLRAILGQWSRIDIVGEVGNGRDLVEMVESLKPDLAIIDACMAELNGIDAARAIRQLHPATRVLIFSTHVSEDTVIEAVQVGVQGYVVKDATPEELHRAARNVIAGRTYFSAEVAGVLAMSIGRQGKRGARLSPREREVVQLVSEGARIGDIAKRLFVSPQTVKSHRANAMRKLKLETTVDLVRYAMRHGVTRA